MNGVLEELFQRFSFLASKIPPINIYNRMLLVLQSNSLTLGVMTMQYFRSFFSALGMFTAIPMPQIDWDMEHGSRMTACLGLVGAVLGGLLACLVWIFVRFSIPAPLFSVLTVAAACLLTGFLHLDGFMDVCDALLSHRDEEGRRRILKDPHCGSFAVISLLFVLAADLASVWLLRNASAGSAAWTALLIGIPTLSRCAAGLLLIGVKTMPGSSLGAYFKTGNSAAVKTVLLLTGILALAATIFFAGLVCGAAVATGLLLGTLLGLYAARRLGGINGDVSGFTIVFCETCMLLALALLAEAPGFGFCLL